LTTLHAGRSLDNLDCKELDNRFGVCLTGKNADGVNFAPHIYVESKKPFNPHKKESTRGGNMQKDTTFSDVDLKLDKNSHTNFNRPDAFAGRLANPELCNINEVRMKPIKQKAMLLEINNKRE